MIVIDSSALMALVRNEAGAERVAAAIGDAMVSAVILAECLGKLSGLGFDPDAVRERFAILGLDVEAFDSGNVAAVVGLQALSRRKVSFADRVCLGLALDRQLPVLTGDRAWTDLGLPLRIELIR